MNTIQTTRDEASGTKANESWVRFFSTALELAEQVRSRRAARQAELGQVQQPENERVSSGEVGLESITDRRLVL